MFQPSMKGCVPVIAQLSTRYLINENKKLRRQIEELKRQCYVDALTGVSNRRALFETIESELTKAKESENGLVLVIMDLDDFKLINDHFGHQKGDEVLKTVAKVIRDNIRKGDHVGRYGGEEFVLLFPGTTLKQTMRIVERIRRCIERIYVNDGNISRRISASFGVTCTCQDNETTMNLINEADDALYSAKKSGKNCIIVNRLLALG